MTDGNGERVVVEKFLEKSRSQRLDELTADDPAGAFAHLLWLHGPAALGIRTFTMRDIDIDPVGRVSFPHHDPPYAVLPEPSETWEASNGR